MVTVLCIKWGTAYGAPDVNVLRAMVARHLRLPHRFVCLTERPEGIDPAVEIRPLPEMRLPKNPDANGGWRKIGVLSRAYADLPGPILFLDLDVVVTGSLDVFFEHPGRFCIIENWTTPFQRIGNSSVFRFEPGREAYVLDAFEADPDAAIASVDNEQIYVSRHVEELVWWPKAWVRSYKFHCLRPGPLARFLPPRLPRGCRIVAFHGKPKPDEAIAGSWIDKKGRPVQVRSAPWLAEHWRL
ncbi:MAG: hypothetical protein ACOC3D_12895 [Pseudomonadota bacterium]